MKKMSVMLAAMTLTGIASAQTVTVFGIADIAVSRFSVGSASITGPNVSGMDNARLGFRGTEDLGGGLSAAFWLEAPLNVNDGTSGAGGLAFTRRSTVSLIGPWGELRLGRENTATYYNDGYFDPFNATGVGMPVVLLARSTSTAAGRYRWTSTFGANNPVSLRSNNVIDYLLPPGLGGLYGQIQYAPSERTGSKQGEYQGIRVGYKSGPLDAALAVGKLYGSNPLTAAAPDVATVNAAASYVFGFGTLMGEYSSESYTSAAAKNKSTGYLLGLVAPVGALDLKVAYSSIKLDIAGTPKSSKWAVGAVYNFSKRTAIYATAASLHNEGGALLTVNPIINGVANATSVGYDFGVRHRF